MDFYNQQQMQQQQQQQQLNNDDYSVNISIEPNHECEIQEIKYDGEEIYKEPLSQSENLALLISKIDFSEEFGLSYSNPDSVEQQKEKSKESVKNSSKLAQIFHRNVYDKVKQAYDEVCVLLDCLQIVTGANGALLSLEPGRFVAEDDTRFNEFNEKTLNTILKKKNIDAAKCMVKKFVDKILNDTHDYNNNKFHIELYRLRLFWRLKKIGTKFLGDFGYRTIGSINALKGNFEVIKKDNMPNDHRQVEVLLFEDNEDEAFIQVQLISNDEAELSDNKAFSIFKTNQKTHANDTYWYYLLENAQNSLYAKELFNQLLRECFEMQSQLKTVIIGNSIELTIKPTVHLVITLCYQSQSKSSTNDQNKSNLNLNEHVNYLLEYLLNQLLRKYFQQNLTYMDLRPVTSMIAYNHKVKNAGITYSKEYATKRLSLLQSIKDIAEHILVKKKVIDMLAEISKDICEPIVYVEPFLRNTSTSIDIQIAIFSSFYENIAKFNYYIKIRNSKVQVLSETNTIDFTDNIENIKSYLFDQACLQQMKCIEHISTIFGWQILTNGQIETDTYQSSVLLLWNNSLTKKIAIKLGPVNNIDIHVNNYEPYGKGSSNNNDSIQPLVTSQTDYFGKYLDMISTENDFVRIDLFKAYPGQTLISKFEFFLADIALE